MIESIYVITTNHAHTNRQIFITGKDNEEFPMGDRKTRNFNEILNKVPHMTQKGTIYFLVAISVAWVLYNIITAGLKLIIPTSPFFLDIHNSISISLLFVLAFITVLSSLLVKEYTEINKTSEAIDTSKNDIKKDIKDSSNSIENIRNELYGIENLFKLESYTKYLETRPKFYEDLTSITNSYNEQTTICSTLLVVSIAQNDDPSYIKPYINYLDTLVNKIKEDNTKGGSLGYDVLIGLPDNCDGKPEEYRYRDILLRQKLFYDHTIYNRLSIKHKDIPFFLDFTIIGDHVFIATPTLSDRQIRSGIRITNKKFASSMRDWYYKNLWGEGKQELCDEWKDEGNLSNRVKQYLPCMDDWLNKYSNLSKYQKI